MDRLEELRLKQENQSLRMQIMQRDTAVAEYQKLLVEAAQTQQEIMKIEEEVRKNEEANRNRDIFDPGFTERPANPLYR